MDIKNNETNGKSEEAPDDFLDERPLGEEECRELVSAFFRRISEASGTLATVNNGEDHDMMTDDSDDAIDPARQIDKIARNLLKACRPDILSSGIDGLPKLKTEETNFPEPGEDDEPFSNPYIYRRTDYLRQLLRLLSSSSMDIAAQVCSVAIASNDSPSFSSSYSLESFLLFSYWLPLAPHLAPMVTDLFTTLDDPLTQTATKTTTHETRFILSEACYNLCSFFSKCENIDSIQGLCDWSFVFNMFQSEEEDVEMTDDSQHNNFSYDKAIRWYAAHCVGYLLDWKASVVSSVLDKAGLKLDHIPWRPHPWVIDQEEANMQRAHFRRSATLWDDSSEEEFPIPNAQQVQEHTKPSTILARVGNGICFYRDGSILDSDNFGERVSSKARKLIPTPTTCRNLALVGAALCQVYSPAPVLICGPQGSGKSSLVRELLRMCRPKESLLEFHVDEETDSKTLIGSYTTTDVPGEFAWRAGPLTHATREGRWVLLEDVDSVPVEIQAALVKLLKDRILPLGNGNYERCHPSFRLFGTCSTTPASQRQNHQSLRIAANRGGGKRVFNPSLWRKVHVNPLPYSELKEVACSLHPEMPSSVVESAVDLFQAVDRSGRALSLHPEEGLDTPEAQTGDASQAIRATVAWTGGREPSVRDFFKLLSRVSNSVSFEQAAVYTTESQRTFCMAESVDIFVGSCPDPQVKMEFVEQIAAASWGITRDLAKSYVESRRPSLTVGVDFVDVGRARIHVGSKAEFSQGKSSNTFAQTNYALRLMESVGVCLRENEPVLLVGETGCGKTTLIQQLATVCERDLLVQNLSLQTDSTDLLGGYKPLDMKTVARKVYSEFVDIFVSTFSRKQNLKFLKYASSMLEKLNWKKLSQCFQRAAELGIAKMAESPSNKRATGPTMDSWNKFSKTCERFERQRLSCDAGLAFAFSEGVLVDAITHGKWVLLDEINLASSETLQRLCGLLDDPSGSVTLTERGDASAIIRHPNFRLFAAMNPATDAGKKDLPPSIRSRFSEIYVDELLDPVELRTIASRYLDAILPNDGTPPESSELVISVVDVYLKCREMAEKLLVDGAGHKPRYTLRTLSRALSAGKQLVLQQRLPRNRAIFEGFQLAFEGSLDAASIKVVRKLLKSLLSGDGRKPDLEHPGKRPGGKNAAETYILVKPFWIKAGPNEALDWSETSSVGKPRFILTPSIATSLRRLSRALAAGNWPVLLEGPTSAGKTTLVEYIATRCGHRVVRINNHEHTDIQEYTGSFAADSSGSLSFRDGLLVRALRFGYWVILDELNLAPSEVLEALNRLLDDNRELFIAEINETVKPHPNFRLFATQNPCGAYGGRKPLSRAFRNRFVEIHMGDIPNVEMKTILEQKCGCPPSHAKHLVDIMISLRHRRSKSNLFLGKDSFITPRDLLRWAERKGSTKQDLAEQGYMLLAERLRSREERDLVQDVLEENLKVKLSMEELYFGTRSKARTLLTETLESSEYKADHFFSSIAPTTSLLRLISLVLACIHQKEPVLLVGDTGCGKTTVVQFLSHVLRKKLHSVNCHATTETSDLLGGLRPVRGRHVIARKILVKLKTLISLWPHQNMLDRAKMPVCLFHDKTGEGMLIDESDTEGMGEQQLEASDVSELLSLARTVFKARPAQGGMDAREVKRRKLTPDGQHEASDGEVDESLKKLVGDIEELGRRYNSLFEWSDGPLVHAMKTGEMMLLDEMSLAEDAVLERLNSVLEPSRTLVLAEKGESGPRGSEIGSSVIVAQDGFRIFATMNPGGDFGKRELSPALRSRFTEIWVPPVSHRADFELVLGRTLIPRNLEEKSPTSTMLECILSYVEWFNTSICGDPSSQYSGHSLSLRDVLSWARFIVEARVANEDLGMWEAYCHGACLMHLDGLGLGSGLALEDASTVRRKAEEFLVGRVPKGAPVSNLGGAEESLKVDANNRFGAFPFFIPTGALPIRNMAFNLEAPTTAQNMFRVLRAMQVRKPVLLEGSPGVGKTSLISALATASGHKLVRINLSEQTDISDLMGSDLPMQDSTATGASFEWCDGVLLTAIKEGNWVLLDELNLASQSVLEGLNSCLDHRAEVFIPELGRTFSCPPSFRIFAAQNPLAQGGGRKGLPRSFLNRFTKVFVSSLSDGDLRAIVSSNYPTFDRSLIHNMIDFNKQIHEDVVEKREYGFEGSPWEFNLRDVFRWCDLVSTGSSSLETHARDLYYQRFRTLLDRDRVDRTFEKYFNSTMKLQKRSKIRVLESTVEVGDSVLERQPLLRGNPSNPLSQERVVSLSRQMSSEAVARCVACNWPCLLVGAAGSGKTSIVTSLAELCNTKLVAQCLSPSSDVTELVGCFEQVDSAAAERQCLEDVCSIAEEFLIADFLGSEEVQKVWRLLLALKKYALDQAEASDPFSGVFRARDPVHTMIFNLSRVLLIESENKLTLSQESGDKLQEIVTKLSNCNKVGKEKGEDNGAHFIWRDGTLVEAMESGFWLLLENVNLCPSSVLDRLNSVMERDGELLLSECGPQDKSNTESSHRRIKPHKNFRIFLSMDPVNGEVSRAMRNRCVEIAILQSTEPRQNTGAEQVTNRLALTNDEKVDCLGMLQHEGIRSIELASLVLSTYSKEKMASATSGEENPCLAEVLKSSSILSGLISRGIAGNVALKQSLQLSFQVGEETVAQHLAQIHLKPLGGDPWTPLPLALPIRSTWIMNTGLQPVTWEARLLRLFLSSKSNVFSVLSSPELGLLDAPTEDAPNQQSYAFKVDACDNAKLADELAQLYVTKSTPADFQTRYNSFDGMENCTSLAIGWMTTFMQHELRAAPKQTSGESSSALALSIGNTWFSFPHRVRKLQFGRLGQRLREWKWFRVVSSKHSANDALQDMSALEASYYVHESLLDRSSVSCPVLPCLYPFFICIDTFIYLALKDIVCTDPEEEWSLDPCSSLMDERDRLWCHLAECKLSSRPESVFCFEESTFIVQWKWLKKSFGRLSADGYCSTLSETTQVHMAKLEAIMDSIDQAVFGNGLGMSTAVLRKRMVRPKLPRDAKNWEMIFEIREISQKCTVLSEQSFDPFIHEDASVNMQTLVDCHHPVLFTSTEDRFQLLTALCTIHWSWTDEVKNEDSSNSSLLSGIDFGAKFKAMLVRKRQAFEAEVARAKIDLSISTVDNQFSAEALDGLKELSAASLSSGEAYGRLGKSLLSTFHRVQTSGLAEFWCANEENRLCNDISILLLDESAGPREMQNKLSVMLPRIKLLVSTVLKKTVWSIADMRPFQTLIWVLEGPPEKDFDANELLRCLLPTILFSRSRHLFVNSFVNNSVVSESLELPSTWTDDEATTRKSHIRTVDSKTDVYSPFGSGILRRQYRSEFMLRLMGKQLTLSENPTSARFHTMENSTFRSMQYRDITEILSFSPVANATTESQLSIAYFLLNDILHAFQAIPGAGEVERLLARLNSPSSAHDSKLKSLVSGNKDPVDPQIGQLVTELITPLVESYILASHAKVGSKERDEHSAVVGVYIGLVRLHILRPDSPLDPGREPLAKVALIDRKLDGAKLRMTAIRLDKGFIEGDFSPLSSDCRHLLDNAMEMNKKRESLEKKVIHRITSAPHFSELFRDTNDFIATAARSDTVLKLVHDFRTTGNRAAIHSWQRTAMAFCRRLDKEYKAFEDFTSPLITSVQMIQDGLNVLTESSFDRCGDIELETFEHLTQFPFQDHSEVIKASARTLSNVARRSQDLSDQKRTNCHFSISLALLTRVSLKSLESGLDCGDVAACCKVFDALARSHLGSDDGRKDESVDEEQEREYREQFPDHRKDFKELLEVDNDDESHSDMEIPEDDNTGSRAFLSDTQIGLLCSVHDMIFSTNMEGISDSFRTFAFHCAYGAAFELNDAAACLKDLRIDSESLGGHVFAMSLTAPPTTGTFRVYPHLPSNSSAVDFHNDPLPSEALLAEDPVEKLMARVTQLLTAFPGHSILLGIGRVCEKVRKFDLMTTPIGKVMTGLEVVLKHSQGWEQHASDKVKLGNSLKAVGQLIARWRKLELESWPSLLQARQVKHVRKTRKHWMRLHQVLFADTKDELGETVDGGISVLRLANFQTSSPKWIWKGLSSLRGHSLPSDEKASEEELGELVKALDTFVLTSSLGEFEERMRILQSYSIQLAVVHNLSGEDSSWRLRQARILSSIWSYYNQFRDVLMTKLETLRKPLEKELSEEVKLAKWDEQSYYALAESTERNHRKLMKVLTKYDECLGLNVALLIQEETYRGVRSDPNVDEEVSSSVPPTSAMFPLTATEHTRQQKKKSKHTAKSGMATIWVDPLQIGIKAEGHIGKLEKYAKKMISMAEKGTALSDSWGSIGSEVAASFCEAIFDRMEALRTKSTRPMKERALVDLFRELKRNGFSTTKWSVPSQARQMEQLFQLPAPSLSALDIADALEPVLAKAEQYYFRSLVEVHAFRSEVKAYGSKHMSTRQMELMVNMGGSGVFMLAQQRCLLSGIIRDVIGLKECTTNMKFHKPNLPTPQSTLRGSICSFNRATRIAVESVHELSLFIKASRGFLKDDISSWARDVIAKLESVAFVPSTPDCRLGKVELVEWKDMDNVRSDGEKLAKAEKVVRDCYESCKTSGCLPGDIFDAPMTKILEAIKVGSNCKVSLGDSNSSEALGSRLGSFGKELSAAVERALISFQSFSSEASRSREPEEPDGGDSSSDAAILECHKKLGHAWSEINLTSLSSSMKNVLHLLCEQLDNSHISDKDAECCLRLVSNANILSERVLSLAETLLEDTIRFFSVTAKLNYILLRLYRVLVAKGFCSDKVSEDDSGDAEGDVSGMTFEDDQEGTGMGEGEGKTDVTDQLESEEQLLGLKSDNDNGEEEERESKKLNEEEAEQGMEMENDFDGETFDLPEKQDENNEDENDEEGEELDRQMGDGPTPDEQVVDERMWNESDDEDEINEDEEKFEKDTNVGGEAIEGATHTKDDGSDEEKGPENAAEKSADLANQDDKENEGGEAEDQPDDTPNNDDDDQYEESHGVDVRNEGQDEDQNADGDDGMEIEDDLCLDDEDGEADQPDGQDENLVDQDDADDSQSVDSAKEGEVDAEHIPEDEDEDSGESGDAQPMSVTEPDFEPKEDEQAQHDETEEAMKEEPINNTDHQASAEGAHGVQGSEGIDTAMEDEQDGANDKQGEDTDAGAGGNSQSQMSESNGDGGDGYSDRNEKMDQSGDNQTQDKSLDIPNPFKNPGDASKFWHRKLDIIEASEEHEESTDVPADELESNQGDNGEFQFTADQQATTQVLGETTQEDAVELDHQHQEEALEGDKEEKKEKTRPEKDNPKAKQNASLQTKKETSTNQTNAVENDDDSNGSDDESAAKEETREDDDEMSNASGEELDENLAANMVVSDMSKLAMDHAAKEEILGTKMIQDEQVSGISSAEAAEARTHWLQIQGETHSLSRRLCEKLRLVMEPLVASKLRGDYRSGKRINMKRVISYIASGYRKDKIWLRRTKPAKRDYRVLLAVDDSESMRKSGAGEMALRAMATLAIGMNQLEIGELGVASFGDDMKLLHPFHLPFTSEAGADMVMNCRFDQPRTRISLCVESAIASLEEFGDNASMQLVFLISDGRIERDSRAAVKRLVREMVERNILLAMIIVEGENKKKDSIVNMKEVTFEKGKPVVKQFIDDYPFPYYIVLEDLTTLPEVMGDALRQWFEMLAQLRQN